jgi:hypothetical protein
MAGKPSHPTTAPRLSKHLACLCHACCFGALSVAPLSPRRVTTRLCCRSLFLGTYGTRHNVAPPLGLCSSQWDSAFATMSSLSTSLLPLRSSLVRHATPCSGSCSCVASIILRRQIVPCSAYSAEQSGHDFSQRGLRLGDSFRI